MYPLLLFVFVLTTAQSQTIFNNVGDFKEVKVFDRIQVNLIKSDSQKIEIEGNDRNQVVVINKDGILKIRMKTNKMFDGADILILVYYKNIDVIDANEGSYIYVNKVIDNDVITVNTQEGATVTLDLAVQKAHFKAITGGHIIAKGSAATQDVYVSTGGVLKAKPLHTIDTNVFIQAGGNVDIHATNSAKIKIRAGGDVNIYGNPKRVSKNKVLGGSIIVHRK